jgi:hypothetical protein
MDNFVNMIKKYKDFYHLSGADDTRIMSAEDMLSVKFAVDFTEYLKCYGIASANGHELTGIISSPRLNVVDVTVSAKSSTPDIPSNWYAIEQVNIDGIVIWQSSTGEIYQTIPNAEPIKLCNSLSEYLEL